MATSETTRGKRAAGMALVVECLPSKSEALSSNPSTTNDREGGREKEREGEREKGRQRKKECFGSTYTKILHGPYARIIHFPFSNVQGRETEA
jgi:hypothetical protein